ncbi:unnamed protein product [Caenorhabditis angaria]|uniref:Uncharacterized protein n=1 Tax=Caenorhabditis angaria TaxID=860376 RepID=A0A9P1I7H5_9PELO|nr:unnamed protein product [Caenorhabditis angaria]
MMLSQKLFNEIRADPKLLSSYDNAGYPLDKFCSLLAHDSFDDLKSTLDIYGWRSSCPKFPVPTIAPPRRNPLEIIIEEK